MLASLIVKLTINKIPLHLKILCGLGIFHFVRNSEICTVVKESELILSEMSFTYVILIVDKNSFRMFTGSSLMGMRVIVKVLKCTG